MKKLAAVLLLLASFRAGADMVVSELVESGGQTQNVTIKIKGDKMRVDMAGQVSTITDTSTGDIITILHAQKSYMKMSSSKTKELMAKMQALQGAPSPSATEKPKIVDTGRKEKVNDYNTGVYTAETPTMKFTYWIAKDFPNGAVIQEQMKKLQSGMQSKMGMGANAVPDTSTLPGIPLKTEIVTNGQTITTTLIAAKSDPVADTEFATPVDYTEMQIPAMNGPAPAAPAEPAPPAAPQP